MVGPSLSPYYDKYGIFFYSTRMQLFWHYLPNIFNKKVQTIEKVMKKNVLGWGHSLLSHDLILFACKTIVDHFGFGPSRKISLKRPYTLDEFFSS